MKALEILLSFLMSQGRSAVQSSTEAVTHEIVARTRRVVILLTVTVIAIVLFCSGFSMAYAAAADNWANGVEWSSPRFVMGCALTAASLIALLYALGEKRWLAATGLQAAPAAVPPAPPTPSLESAFALLITEFAQDMKASRERAPETPGPSSPNAPQV